MKFVRYWIPALIWAGVIFYLSSRERISLPEFPLIDKLAHIGVYSIFGFLVARILMKRFGLDLFATAMAGLVAAGMYGATDEIHQLFVPPRTAELMDLISDFFGGLIGALSYGYISRILKIR